MLCHDFMSGAGFAVPERKIIYSAVYEVPEVYLQGNLDGCCGFYSLVNAINYLRGPFDRNELNKLFGLLLKKHEEHWTVSESFVEGLNGYQLSHLINQIAKELYQLSYKKPFHKSPKAHSVQVWKTITEWVQQGGVVIMGEYDHWTVVNRVSKKYAYLLDSSGRRRIEINHLNSDSQLYPQHLYFLKRLEDCYE